MVLVVVWELTGVGLPGTIYWCLSENHWFPAPCSLSLPDSTSHLWVHTMHIILWISTGRSMKTTKIYDPDPWRTWIHSSFLADICVVFIKLLVNHRSFYQNLETWTLVDPGSTYMSPSALMSAVRSWFQSATRAGSESDWSGVNR